MALSLLWTLSHLSENTSCLIQRFFVLEFFWASLVRIMLLCGNGSSQCSTTGVTKAVVCVILSGIIMMHIKELLLLIGKSSPCGGSGFPLSLSEWSFTIFLMPYDITVNKMC